MVVTRVIRVASWAWLGSDRCNFGAPSQHLTLATASLTQSIHLLGTGAVNIGCVVGLHKLEAHYVLKYAPNNRAVAWSISTEGFQGWLYPVGQPQILFSV